ncbi:MarR family winged helix-turn-helix transcriptional regulator [Rubellimicrobium roseum]|uniref:MarR family transcriptional regulator n=1 Tax=Rubellimicrobium roseum TaxID=687525 RepID=A0A5C4N887_9RHOB|nr:MarR family transcriptional regulator [Rubellimicrobium roseum]TNC69824.1 MarR family transcriptional regulator [Rubellimicrobium roseum]
MPDTTTDLWFRVLNEVAIIDQLARALFEARLPSGFLVSHFSVLNHLIRVGDGRTPLELARAFQVPKTTMTHTLGGLERAHLVEMRPNPEDGRSKRVWITEEGRAFREEAIAGLGPDVARLAALVPEETMAALVPGLEALRRALDADRDRPGPP